MHTETDYIETLEASLGACAPGTLEEVDVLNALGWALVPLDIRRAIRHYEGADRLAQRLSYAVGRARAQLGYAYRDFFRAAYGEALDRLREVAPVLRDEGNLDDRAIVLLLEGVVHWSLGDFELAMDLLHRCHEISLDAGYVVGEGWALTSLASIHEGLGDVDKAIELHRSAVERFRTVGNTVSEARASAGLGMAYLRVGEYEKALEQQRLSLALSRRVGSELSAARALNDMGLAFRAQRDLSGARGCLEEALTIRTRFENWPAVATTLLALGDVLIETGEPERAVQLLEEATEICERTAILPKLWRAHDGLSRAHECRGDYKEALEHQRRAQAIKEDVQGDEANTKLKNMQVRLEVEAAEKEAERIKQAQARLVQSEKMAAVGRLVAGVAHELNSPVAALRCGIDVQRLAASKVRDLVQGGSADELERMIATLENGAQTAETASRRIADMVGSLKRFSQLDQADFQRADLVENIRSTLDLLRPHWGDRIRVDEELEALPKIECYPGALNQALMTLLINAGESMEGTGTVTVRAQSGKDVVRLSVADQGRGIARDELERLFEIGFSRTGQRVRMNVGLANVQDVVEKHHGQIKVASELGKGTTFEIELPVRQPS